MSGRRMTLILAALLVTIAAGCGDDKTQAKPPKQKAPATPPAKVTPATPPAKTGLVRVGLKLPKPMFVGTPKNIRTPNLEPDKGGKLRPKHLMLPPGVTNVALRKPVTCSDDEPVIGEPEQVTDGDKEGRDGSYLEIGSGKQHVQIDLGAPHTIYKILVWHYHSQARVYRDVIVQVADDPDFIMNVRTLFNNDHDGTAGLGIGKDYEYIETFEGKLIDAGGVKARYVRLYSNGNTSSEMNHCTEVEVYGKK